MRNILIFCITLIVLIFNSCIYDSDEIVFKEIKRPKEIPPISFVNTPVNGDTIFIDAIYETDIIIDAGEYEIVKNVVQINGKNHYSNDFVMNTKSWPYSDTPYTIELELEISPNNGTIADELGLESYISKRSFIVKRIRNISNILIKEEAVEGMYKFTWPSINYERFDKYIITKTIPSQGRILETIETEDNWLIDQFNIGEISNWNIEMRDLDGRTYKLWKVNNEGYNLTFDNNALGQYFLKWNKCKFPNNFKKLLVYKVINFGEDELIYQTSDINDTIVKISGTFGSSGRYYIRAELQNKPKYLIEDYVIYGSRSGYLGDPFDEQNITKFWQINEDNLLIIRNQHVYRYSNSLNRIVDSLEYDYYREYGFWISGDGQRLSNINNDNDKVLIWNTNNFSSTPLIEKDFRYITNIRITNTDICLRQISSDGIELYDLKSNSVLDRLNDAYVHRSFISHDGKYVFVYSPSEAMYEIQGGRFVKIFDYPEDYYHYEAFDPLNPHVFWTYGYRGLLEAYDIKQKKYIKQIEVKNTVNHIDFYSRKGLGSINDDLIVFDIDTGEILNRIPCDLGIGYFNNDICIINNTIYSTRGIKYEL